VPDAIDDSCEGEWWLWRMSDRELLPIRRDEDGVDWPYLGESLPRMIVVEELLRSGVDVREERPVLRPGALGSFAIGWPPTIAMIVGLGLMFTPGLPEALRAVGGISFVLLPAALAAIVGYRRARALPPDLRDLARSEVHASSTEIRVRPWVAGVVLAVLVVSVLLFGMKAVLEP